MKSLGQYQPFRPLWIALTPLTYRKFSVHSIRFEKLERFRNPRWSDLTLLNRR